LSVLIKRGVPWVDSRRTPIVTLGLTLCAATLAVAGQGRALASSQLTPSEMEAFLLQAKIVDIREAGGGLPVRSAPH
jgi:hypothetical protein